MLPVDVVMCWKIIAQLLELISSANRLNFDVVIAGYIGDWHTVEDDISRCDLNSFAVVLYSKAVSAYTCSELLSTADTLRFKIVIAWYIVGDDIPCRSLNSGPG